MLESAWLFVGVVGILATATAVVTPDDGVAIVAGVAGFVTWGVWTFGSLNLEKPIQGNPELVFSEPAITLLGIGLALVPAYIALTGPVEIIGRARRGETRPDEF